MRVVLSDQSVIDSDGDRIMVEGISLKRYEKHPILLFMHDQVKMPIGKIKDIKIEGDQLTGVPEYDEDDDFAMWVKSKADKGYVGFSIGYKELEQSSDIALKLDGQKNDTTTKSELFEVSVAIIPSNPNALAMVEKKVNELKLKHQTNIKKSKKSKPKMELVKKHLKLDNDATEQQVLAKVQDLETKNANLSKELSEMKQKTAEDKADVLVQAAVDAGKITKKEAAQYKKFAITDYDGVKSLLDEKQARKSIQEQLKGGGVDTIQAKYAARTKEGLTFQDWQKKYSKDLAILKDKEPELFKELLTTLK